MGAALNGFRKDGGILTVDHGLDEVAHLGHANLDVEALSLLRHEMYRAVVLRATTRVAVGAKAASASSEKKG